MNKQEFIEKLFESAKNAGIGECEAYYAAGDNLSVEVLNGQIKEYSAAISAGLCFRGVYNGRMGYASTEEMDEDAIDMLIGGVKQNACLLETDDRETVFEGSAEYAKLDLCAQEAVEMPAAEKIRLALELEKKTLAGDSRVQRTEGCEYFSSVSERRIVNSRGLDVSFRKAILGAGAAPIVSENGKVNFDYETEYGFRPEEIHIDEVARKSVEKAISGLNAQSIPSGNYRTVLRNDAAATILATFAGVFSAENARKGMSLLKGREGEIIASEAVTIIDDPLMENGFASVPFDAEGMATFTKTVVEKGRLNTLLHNRTTAAAMGASSTANASKEGYAGPVRVAPTNFYIQPSDTGFEDLIRSVGNGLLITRLMGMHSGANQISGDFSLGAKGYKIENGKVTEAVEQITIAANFFDLLKNIRAVASDLRFGHPGNTAIGCPALDVGMISVAGK